MLRPSVLLLLGLLGLLGFTVGDGGNGSMGAGVLTATDDKKDDDDDGESDVVVGEEIVNFSAASTSIGKQGDNDDEAQKMTTPSQPSFLYILVDDIGWGDFRYNNGTAATPNIDRWLSRDGTLKLQDFHSGGTICSPTRATILTGRNHFRDCVDTYYQCDDMTTCIPHFEFAPSRTYTVGDAIRSWGRQSSSGGYEDGIYFSGKWHLGSFYNDSEFYGGLTSSPITHGFDHFNATVEVVPTATANCRCKEEWMDKCNFGHYGEQTHCSSKDRRCCFNYWWDDPVQPHGVMNLTWPTPEDDSLYLVDAFERFLSSRLHSSSTDCDGGRNKNNNNRPFFAQISFHNCHKPFIGTNESVSACARNETCRPPSPDDPPYTPLELDYYACLSQLDHAMGRVLDALETNGYYDNTMIWFSSDNGPEENCPPMGICQRADSHPQRPLEGPASAGLLRGRKRDIYEGGHRVPGIISWPARIHHRDDDAGGRELWETIVTTDFLPTIMDILDVERPHHQRSWAMDGRSILPILHGSTWEETPEGPRSFGIGYNDPHLKITNGWGYRHGKWKYVVGSSSCQTEDCLKEQLYNLDTDLGERHDLSMDNPEMLKSLRDKFFDWHESVLQSRKEESKCRILNNLVLPPFLDELRLTWRNEREAIDER